MTLQEALDYVNRFDPPDDYERRMIRQVVEAARLVAQADEWIWECKTHPYHYAPDWPGKTPLRCSLGMEEWEQDASSEDCRMVRRRLLPPEEEA